MAANRRGITAAQYNALLKTHFPDGNVPRAVPPPTKRIAKHPRRFPCGHCGYVATTQGLLRRHEADAHDLNVKWHYCDFRFEDGGMCTYRGKSSDDVLEHLRKAHNVGVRWHACDQEGCTFKTKTASALVKHKANRHDIDVKWHYCQVPGCAFVCKQRGNLLQHARWMHSGRPITHKSRMERNRVVEVDSDETCPMSELDVDSDYATDEEALPPILSKQAAPSCVLCTLSMDSESEPSLSPPGTPLGDCDKEEDAIASE